MAKRITKKSIAATKKACSIQAIVGDDVALTPHDGYLTGPSPFRRTGEIRVSPEHQRYRCMDSGLRGDVIHYVSKRKGISFMGTVRLLAKRTGVVLEYEDDERVNRQADFDFSKVG